MNLRPYQAKGKTDIYDSWRSYKRVMFQLVTGGGKTVIFVNIIRDILKKGKRIILIAHREELIVQAWQTLYKNQIYSGVIKGDQPTNFSLPCQVASIQTLARRKKLPHADVVIFDEAHHCQDSNTYGKVLSDFFPHAYVLGVTATPYRLSGHGFTDMFDKLVLSKSYGELVQDGYLTPYKYFVGSVPDLSDLKLSKGDYREKDAEKVMELAPLVESYIEYCNGMSGVVFAVNINHSKEIVRKYNAAGIRAAHLDADTPAGDRKNILKLFKEGIIKIISNVGIITEGFDFPNMDFVQLASPTMSLSRFLQMVGRTMRVNQAVIDGIEDPEERRKAISESSKPFAYILDNAGCWETHGLPDQYFDWQMYFEGVDKKKKKEETEMIEMIEYVAESPDGLIVRTKDPQEVAGMKLIEVKTHIKQTIYKVTSIKKFDELIELARRLKNVKKKGFFAVFKFVEYCEKNHILINDQAWEYVFEKVSSEPKREVRLAEQYEMNTLQAIREQYGHNQAEADRLAAGLKTQISKRIEKGKLFQVPIGFLRKIRAEHEDRMRMKEQVKMKMTGTN